MTFTCRLDTLLATCQAYMAEQPPEVSTEALQEQAEHSDQLWESLHQMKQELQVKFITFNLLCYLL